MEQLEDKHLVLVVTEYASKKKRFTLEKLRTDLELDKSDFQYLTNTLVSHSMGSSDNPNHILIIVSVTANGSNDEYSLLPNALYNYIDFIEIKEARRNAEDAKKQSNLALQLTVFAIIISVLLGLGQLLFDVFDKIYKFWI